MLPEFTVQLDRPRICRFNAVAEDRLGQMENPPSYGDLASRNPFKLRRAVAAFVLCSQTDDDQITELTRVIELLPPGSKKFEQVRDAVSDAVLAYLGTGAEQKKSEDSSTAGRS